MAKVCPVQDSLSVCDRKQDNLDLSASSAIQYADLLLGFSLKENLEKPLHVMRSIINSTQTKNGTASKAIPFFDTEIPSVLS